MVRLNPECDVLANLSGGLDSVYGIWQLLLEGRKPLIHHCHLSGNLRQPWESQATADVLGWFQARGLGNFEYIDSHVELPPTVYRSRMRDPELIMMIAGQVLRDRPHIREMAYFNNAEDTSTRHPRTKRRRENILYYWAHRRNIKITRPIVHLTKADIVRALPHDLFEASHWCRFPGSRGEPCHRCIPCKKVDNALEGE
jgi:7-cyano-7-deazaguanine synthase in queuosine biosynthesis